MGRKILVLSIVAFLVIVWSSFIVGVESSSLHRHKRQSENLPASEEANEDHPFGDPIDNERGSPPEPSKEAADAAPESAASSGDNTTTSTTMAPAAGNTTTAEKPDTSEDTNTVTVTVVIVILVIAVVLGVAVFIFLRIRKKRMADYEKKTQIQMSSTSNAGVYIDLTSAPAGDKEKQPKSPETEHLNKEDE